MKNILITLIFCMLTLIAKSQVASVEKSIFGIQTGTSGIWIHNESKLTDVIALRTEIGFDCNIWRTFSRDGNGVVSDEKTHILLMPIATLEPRFYYNLKRRMKKSRTIDGNSGNFISIKSTYTSDWFDISNAEYYVVFGSLSIVPTWGIRRNIGAHFTYEAGVGIGFEHYFANADFPSLDRNRFTTNLHLRIGYGF